MERRYGPRKPVTLDVELYDGRRKLGIFKARNIGLDGIFIETGPFDLCTSGFLDVTLIINRPGIEKHNLKGIVVHQSEEGIGLMFREYDPIFFLVTEALSNAAA